MALSDRHGSPPVRRRQRPRSRALLLDGVGHDLRGLPGSRAGLPRRCGIRADLSAGRCSCLLFVRAATPLAQRVAAHGDGVSDLAIEVPDVDRAVAFARQQGAIRKLTFLVGYT